MCWNRSTDGRTTTRRAALPLLIAALAAGCGSPAFLPEGFEAPAGFETAGFRVRPITVADAEKDYEAVMESVPLIRAALLDDRWPPDSFSLEENRRQLEIKERLARERRSFTYTVVSPDESRVLGCVYINRGRGGPDAAVFLWTRQSAHDAGLDPVLEGAVRGWMKRSWPFERVMYPGRGGSPAEASTAAWIPPAPSAVPVAVQ